MASKQCLHLLGKFLREKRLADEHIGPQHLGLLSEIVRFNREAPRLLSAEGEARRMTLGDFLDSRRFSEAFARRYLLPMASAIWSARSAARPWKSAPASCRPTTTRTKPTSSARRA